MNRQAETTLRNIMYLVDNGYDVSVDWPTRTLVLGNGGVMIDELCRPGFTPATGYPAELSNCHNRAA